MRSKKLLALAPLLAIVASFAVMPGVAQAKEKAGKACKASAGGTCIPHWFKKPGERLTEGERLPVIGWGVQGANLKQKSAAGEINCKTVGSGIVENPVGSTGATEEHFGISGPAGVGQSITASFYECVEPACEAAIAASPLGGLGFVGIGFAVGQNFPWNENLIEGKPTKLGAFEKTIGAPGNGNFGKGFAQGYPAETSFQSGNAGRGGPGSPANEPPGGGWGAAGAVGAIVGCEIFPNPEGLTGVTGSPKRVAFEEHDESEGPTGTTGLHAEVGGALNSSNLGAPGEYVLNGAASGFIATEKTGPATQEGSIKSEGYGQQLVGVKE